MLHTNKVERDISGRKLTIETGKIARQADGAVMVRYGETVVLVSAVTAPPRSEDIDFFPLSVDYREKQSAAGKVPGGFFKREGRPTTKEILTARMIDRPIRPLFPDGYFQEVQIMASVQSADNENDPDILAMIGASAALTISKIPFMGPIGSCRLGRVNGEFVVNPTHNQVAEGDLNLLLGGRKEAINMIEVGANQLSEDVIARAVATAHETVGQICDMIEELRAKVGVDKVMPLIELDEELYNKINSEISGELYEIKQIPDKQKRETEKEELFEKLQTEYLAGGDESKQDTSVVKPVMLQRILDKVQKQVVRKVLLEGKRIDGRAFDDIRPIECEIGLMPRTHGSALFTRGETQAIVSVTLGTIRDAQIIDGLREEYTQNFTLHYNFPPFSVGEVWPNRGPRRREIGHGSLAQRALEAVRPPEDEFAYTVRIVSDITESNGSSSMASVCGGSLALLDAGVPISKAVAGVSIGMITDQKGKHRLLTDIIGEEDHFGDMDFKIAGTKDGITAIQLDIKAEGLPHEIMVEALERARVARLKILEIMNAVISEPKPELSVYAPKLISMEIDPELIGKVIGPGGKMIKSIQEKTGTTIEIEDEGTIYISSVGGVGHLEAKEMIEKLTTPPEVGHMYKDSKVVSVKDFGVFVEISPGVEGLCHISELSNEYVKNVEDVCKVGDLIDVKLKAIDEQGRLKLSRKEAMAEMNKQEKKAEVSKQE